MKKWIAILLVLAIIGGGAWYYFKGKAQPVAAQAPQYTVKKENLDVKVSGSGSVTPVNSKDVLSTVDKVIDQVPVVENQAVKAGQNLVTFTDGSAPITASTDGIVTNVKLVSGNKVSPGAVVMHLTSYSDFQTQINVDELDVPQIQVGQSASITVNAFPDQPYTGKVSAISTEGTVTNGVSTFAVTIHFDKIDNLKVGMTTQANILVTSKANVLAVPITAVHSGKNGEKYVIVPSADGTAAPSTSDTTNKQPQGTRQTVVTGIHNNNMVEIVSGLKEGDKIQLPVITASQSGGGNGSGQRNFLTGTGGGGGTKSLTGGGGREGNK